MTGSNRRRMIHRYDQPLPQLNQKQNTTPALGIVKIIVMGVGCWPIKATSGL